MKKGFMFLFAIVFFTILFNGCGKSKGWVGEYIGKEFTLYDKVHFDATRWSEPFDQKFKCKITITEVEISEGYTGIDLLIDLTDWMDLESLRDGPLQGSFALDDVGARIDGHLFRQSILAPKGGDKYRVCLQLSNNADKISEIHFALFPKDLNSSNDSAFYTIKKPQ